MASAPADPEKALLARALLDRERRGQQLEEEVRKLQGMLAQGVSRESTEFKGPRGWCSPKRCTAVASARPATGLAARPCRRCFSAAATDGRLGPRDQLPCNCSCPSITTAAARPAASPPWRSATGAAGGRGGSGSEANRRPHAADAWAAAGAFGADVGLVTEPVAVLRDVLNLRPEHGAGRCGSGGPSCGPGRVQAAHVAATQEHPGPDGTTSVTGTHDCQQHHPQLVQAAVEEQLRGAYRAMLLQLQHRYATERERQEEAHKLQLQEQAEEHTKVLRDLAEAHSSELAAAATHLEREAAGRRADVHRLEALLSAARAAVESSHGQLAAARAAAEALQAQLQLQRATHEAELMHVRQVTIPLQHHDDIVAHMRAEWDAALKQRERDYASLLQQLSELRQQMSSVGASSAGGARGGSSSGGTGPRDGEGGTESSSSGPGSSDSAARAIAGNEGAGARPAQSGGGSCGENATGQLPQLCRGHNVLEKAQPEPAASAGSIARSPRRRAAAAEDRQGGHPANAAADEAGQQPSTMGTLHVACEPGAASAAGSGAAALPQAPLRFLNSAPAKAAPELYPHRQVQQLRHLRQSHPGPSLPGSGPPSTRAAPSPDRQRQQQPHQLLAGRPASPDAGSFCSSIDPADDLGTAVFELSEDTRRTAFGAAAAAASEAAGAPDVTPQSRGPVDRPTSAGSISLGRMERLVDAVMRGPDKAATSSGQGRSRRGIGASAETDGSWAAADQPWAGSPSTGMGPQHMGSPEGPNTSDATFGRWQGQQQAASTGAAQGGGATQQTGRRVHTPDVVHAKGRSRQPFCCSPRVSPTREAGGARGGSSPSATWGARSGNPAALGNVLRCLRCGLNDVSSPGECRFHPALLPQPGSLVFSPEWLTCQAAGHTFATAGCLVRPQHFYKPHMLLTAQMQPLPAAQGLVQQGQALSPARRTGAVAGAGRSALAGTAQAGGPGAAGASGGRGGASASPRSPLGPARGAASNEDVAQGPAAGPASGVRGVPPASASWAAIAASPSRPAHERSGAVAVAGDRRSPAGAERGGRARWGVGTGAGVSPRGPGRVASGRGVGDSTSPSPRPRNRLPAPLPQR